MANSTCMFIVNPGRPSERGPGKITNTRMIIVRPGDFGRAPKALPEQRGVPLRLGSVGDPSPRETLSAICTSPSWKLGSPYPLGAAFVTVYSLGS
jgi:hypothetical protein